MAEKTYTYVPAELKSAVMGGVVVSTEGVYDYTLNKTLSEINLEQKILNQKVIYWDEENGFFIIDENGLIVDMSNYLTETVISTIESDTENGYSERISTIVVEEISNNDDLKDSLTLTIVNNLGDTYVTADDLEGVGKVLDIQINTDSILDNEGVANISVDGNYDASTNKIATTNTVSGAVNGLADNSDFISNLVSSLTGNSTFMNAIQGGTGVGIGAITWTSNSGGGNSPGVAGTTDTYTVKSNETTPQNIGTFTVYNGANGTSISFKADAASCSVVGDAYIDSSGNLQVLTTLPSTFTNAGAIRGPQGIGGIGISEVVWKSNSSGGNDVSSQGTAGTDDTYSIRSTEHTELGTIVVHNGANGTNGTAGEVSPSDISSAVTNYFSNSPTISSATITTLTNKKTIKLIRTSSTVSSTSVTIDGSSNGDLQIIPISTSINSVSVSATEGLNVTVIFENVSNPAVDLSVSIKNGTTGGNVTYEWYGGTNAGDPVTLTSPVGGYCEVSFLCGASNKFYVRGV